MYKRIILGVILILMSTNVLCGVENYKQMGDGYIKRDSDLALIPMTEANPDYIQYLEDVKSGAKVTDYDYEAEDARQVAAGIETKAATDREELIQERIRKIAVTELVTEGKIEAEVVKE